MSQEDDPVPTALIDPERLTQIVAEGVSDVARWGDARAHAPAWAERGRLLAALVRGETSLFEFGPGTAPISMWLATDVRYAAGDLAPLRDDVVVLDLNAQLPDLAGYDAAAFSGVLEYVFDLRGLTLWLAERFPVVLASYAAATSHSDEEAARRRRNGWVNDKTNDEFEQLFAHAGYVCAQRGSWKAQTLFRFERQ